MSTRMKIGVRLESFGVPVRPALARAAKLGVAGVQVDAVGDLAPHRLSDTGRREFRYLLRSYNLELTALHAPLRRGLDVAEDLQPRIERLRQALGLSFDLGPRVLIVESGGVPADPASPRGLTLTESLLALGQHADRVGSRLALETGLDPGEKLRDFLAKFDTGGLAVNFDPANLLLNGFDPAAQVVPLGRLIAHVHAHDARRSTVSRSAQEVPLGAGDVDWMGLLAALDAVEYRGWLVVERDGDAEEGVPFLRRLVN
jgi:sugar phosphate isomerase/epimerase